MLNFSVLGFSFVASHDKAERTQRGNLLNATGTIYQRSEILLMDDWWELSFLPTMRIGNIHVSHPVFIQIYYCSYGTTEKQNNQDTFIASKTSMDWVQQNTILKHFFCHFNHSKIFYHCAIKAWLWNQRKRRPRATTCHRLLFVSFSQMNKASPCRRRKAPTMTPPWLVVSFSPPLLPSFFNWIRQQSNLNQTFTPGVKDLKDLLYV